MIPLTDEENESYEKQKVCNICKKDFNTDEFNTDENDKNEFNTDENDKKEFNTDENDKNEFNNDENDKNEYKMHLNYTIKSEIIVITLESLEELLIVFAI